MLTRVLEQRGLLGRGRDRELKLQAAQALGKIGGRDAQAVLEATLPTRDPDLRRICEQSLRRLAQAEEA